MENVDFINNLKVRAGFGVTGIAPNSPYQLLTSYDYNDRAYDNGKWVQGIQPSRNPNPDLPQHIRNATQAQPENVWDIQYDGINAANRVIYLIESGEIQIDNQDRKE